MTGSLFWAAFIWLIFNLKHVIKIRQNFALFQNLHKCWEIFSWNILHLKFSGVSHIFFSEYRSGWISFKRDEWVNEVSDWVGFMMVKNKLENVALLQQVSDQYKREKVINVQFWKRASIFFFFLFPCWLQYKHSLIDVIGSFQNLQEL